MPTNTNVTNFHMQYLDVMNQHWDSESENYAGGDHLMTAINNGWQVQKCELVKHWYAGMRFVKIFNFYLGSGTDEELVLPVIHNPYIERFIDEENIQVLEGESKKETA